MIKKCKLIQTMYFDVIQYDGTNECMSQISLMNYGDIGFDGYDFFLISEDEERIFIYKNNYVLKDNDGECHVYTEEEFNKKYEVVND